MATIHVAIVGTIISFICVVTCLVSIATDYWVTYTDGYKYTNEGLWRQCNTRISNCTALGIDHIAAYTHVTRACMITSGVLSTIGVFCVLVVLLGKVGKRTGRIAGVLVYTSAILMTVGTTLYGVEKAPHVAGWGFSIITAWVSAGLAAVGGGLVVHAFEKILSRDFESIN
ncbi:claudin-11-like [Glandiceps talaboti]